MPTYTYKCHNCNKLIELVQKISEQEAPYCESTEHCGKMDIVIQATSFVLLGNRWAKDGYGGK